MMRAVDHSCRAAPGRTGVGGGGRCSVSGGGRSGVGGRWRACLPGAVLARALSAALIATLVTVLGTGVAIAQQTALATVRTTLVTTLDAPAVALAPYLAGVAALGSDGRLTHATNEGVARRLRRGLTSEVLVACEGKLLAVDGSGRLIEVGSGAVGPPVSLHATPLCLPDGRVLALDPTAQRVMLLDASLGRAALAPLDALPDAEPIGVVDDGPVGGSAGGPFVAILVHPSLDYRHGVLGDEVEAEGVAVLDAATLEVVARWSVPGRRVIEQRRLASFPAAGRWGMVATVSGGGDGGALVVLARGDDPAELAVVASGPGIGTEHRWRHVLGASGRRLYTLATPHIGGPLERWTLPASIVGSAPTRLRREAFPLGVTSHRIGQRELDLGRLVPRDASDPVAVDLLAMPTRDLRTLRLIACDQAGCRVSADAELPGAMAAAPWLDRDAAGNVRAWVATDDGSLLLVAFSRDPFPGDGIPSEAE
ncbi:MAG: hypothetical protein U5J97_12290 [Trueperaceae bacterium]|nr:hypothetical protein [Trueperaceae bacterium]